MIKRFAAAFLVLGIAACTPAPPDTSVAEQRFDHMQKLPLTVARIDLQQGMQPEPEVGRRVDTLTNPALATMLERWKAARLKPAGTDGVAVISINRAEIIETRPHLSAAVPEGTRLDPKDLYAGAIEATLQLETTQPDTGLTRRSVITATASRRLSLSANATLATREAEWTALGNRLVADIDAEIERRLGEEGWIVGVELAPSTEAASPLYEQHSLPPSAVLE